MTEQSRPAPAPAELSTQDFLLRPITAADAAGDYEAVMESRADLLGWEQSGWPAQDFTVAENRADLAAMEADHRDGRRFTYTVLSPDASRTLGCVYVVAPSVAFLARAEVRPLADADWAQVQAAVYLWVRSSQADELEPRLLQAVRLWLAEQWRLQRTVHVTTSDFQRQVRQLGEAGLTPQFEIREPNKPTPYLAFG